MSNRRTRERLSRRPAHNWSRSLLIALVAPLLAVAMLFAGPLLAVLVLALAVVSEWALGRPRRAERERKARARRREMLERALARGGASDRPAEGRGTTTARSVAREFAGPRHLRNFRTWWPRGHI